MSKKVFLAGFIALACGVTSMTAQVGINTETPSNKGLHIVQSGDTTGLTNHGQAFRLEDGNQAAGKVLTSDNDGNATWEEPITSVTLKGVITPNQNIPIPMDASSFVWQGTTANTYLSQIVTMDPNSYIDLPNGLWRINAELPVQVQQDINVDDWVEFLLVLSTDPTTTNYVTATAASSAGSAAMNVSVIKGPLKAGYPCRDMVTGYINNTSGTTQRYYLGIGRATVNGNGQGGNAFFGANLIMWPNGLLASIYATSTSW